MPFGQVSKVRHGKPMRTCAWQDAGAGGGAVGAACWVRDLTPAAGVEQQQVMHRNDGMHAEGLPAASDKSTQQSSGKLPDLQGIALLNGLTTKDGPGVL